MTSGSTTTSYYAGRSAQLELHRPSLPPAAVRGASWTWTRFVRPCRCLDSVSHRAGPMMSTSWLHSTTTSLAAFSIVFYHYASTIAARVRQTRGLTRNAAMQSVLHAGWNVRTPPPAAGQLVDPIHQVTRTRQRVLLLRKPLGTNNAVNTASCAVRSVRISGMTRLTPIGAILADYGSQSTFCLAAVACQRTLLSTQSPLSDCHGHVQL